MKVYYNINLQMFGTYEVEDQIISGAAHHLGFSKNDIEDIDTHCANIMFTSTLPPTKVKEHVRAFLASNHPVHYVDVIYRFEYAMVPDRFVVWRDGSCKDYTGYVDFREDV